MLDLAKRLSSTQDFFLAGMQELERAILETEISQEASRVSYNSLQQPCDDTGHTPSDSPLRQSSSTSRKGSHNWLKKTIETVT